MTKTKKQRQEWWLSLTPEEQGNYITERQRKKAKKRKKYGVRNFVTPKLLKKYPWYETGVNETNRQQWLAMIHKKNPWLFEQSLTALE